MAPVRKCKECGGPVKGHQGPFGVGKCKNKPVSQESENEKSLEEDDISESRADGRQEKAKTKKSKDKSKTNETSDDQQKEVPPVEELQEGKKSAVAKKGAKKTKTGKVTKKAERAEEDMQEENSEVGSAEMEQPVQSSPVDSSPLVSGKRPMAVVKPRQEESEDQVGQAKRAREEKAAAAADDDDEPAATAAADEPAATADDDEPAATSDPAREEGGRPKRASFSVPRITVDNSDEEDAAMDEGVDDVSFSDDSASTSVAGDIRKRLFSRSDTEFDIRTFLEKRIFKLCSCPYTSLGSDEEYCGCDCEGKIVMDAGYTGNVSGVYMDPGVSGEERDFRPTFKLPKTGWNKNRPNEVKLKVAKSEDPYIKSCSGEFLIRGEKCVELVKGRKYYTFFLTAVLNFTITPSPLRIRELGGSKKQIKFKEICFDLISEEDNSEHEALQDAHDPKVNLNADSSCSERED